MNLAIDQAKLAASVEEVPVGAVIINPKTKEILSLSHNLVENKNNPTAHAEMLAIESTCNHLKNKSLEGLDLYVTLQPCPMCLQAMIYAKIRRVYFGAYDPDVHLTIPENTNHNLEIYGGIMEKECSTLLKDFFKSKR